MKRKLSEIFKERKIKITPEVIVKIVMVALIVLFILISAISKFAGKKGNMNFLRNINIVNTV